MPAYFLIALKEVSLMTCSILQASSAAVFSSTPRLTKKRVSMVCFDGRTKAAYEAALANA